MMNIGLNAISEYTKFFVTESRNFSKMLLKSTKFFQILLKFTKITKFLLNSTGPDALWIIGIQISNSQPTL